MPSSPMRRLDSGPSEPVGPGSKPESKLSSPRGRFLQPQVSRHFSAKPVAGPGSPLPPFAASRPNRSLQRHPSDSCHQPCPVAGERQPVPFPSSSPGWGVPSKDHSPDQGVFPALSFRREKTDRVGVGEKDPQASIPRVTMKKARCRVGRDQSRVLQGWRWPRQCREERACNHLLPGLISQLVPSAEKKGAAGRMADGSSPTWPGCSGPG